MNASILIIAAFAVFALAIGVMARRGRKLTLEQWAVGGRGFGSLLTFLLMAGEAFSTFSFLGASGWTYSKGVPAFYILSYGCLAFVIGYWMLPAIWRYAKARGLVSFADYFAAKYDSRAIGVLVSVVAVFAMVSLLMIQLRGLGVIVSEMSYGLIPQAAAIWIAATLMAVGSSWTASVTPFAGNLRTSVQQKSAKHLAPSQGFKRQTFMASKCLALMVEQAVQLFTSTLLI